MDDPRWPEDFLAQYDVLEVVGAGGMARVYRAEQRATGRIVAIKLLAPQAFSEEDSRKRFERERDITSQLKHANVVPLLSFGDLDGKPYLVFEFIDGESLRDVLLRERRLPLVRALRYARHVAQGLTSAHAAGIVHRDLKPDNVLVARSDDEARVADFGLARETKPPEGRQRLTQAGIILGTPGYLPPELIRGEPARPASDLFSLGIMLYEMITGYLPLDCSTDHEMLIRYLREDLPPLSARGAVVPQRIERIVASLLRRDPDRRAYEAAKVVDALHYAEMKGDAPDSPGTREQQISRPRSRPSSVTRRSESLRSSGLGRITALSKALGFHRHPRAMAAALAALGAVALVATAGVWLAVRGPDVRRAAWSVEGTPVVIAGATSASVRWQTSTGMPTLLALWRDGDTGESRKIAPPDGAPDGGTRHELTVRRLSAGARWLCAPIFPDGTRAPLSYPIEVRAGVEGLASEATLRYADLSHLEVALEVRDEITAGVQLSAAGGSATTTAPPVVWAPGRGPRKLTLSVPLPRGVSWWQPSIVFRELDDAAAEDAAKNRIVLPRIPTPDALRQHIESFGTKAHPNFDTYAITTEMLRLVPNYYPVKKGSVPTTPQVQELGEDRRKRLVADAQKIVQQRLAAHEVDLALLKSALPLWRDAKDLTSEDRRRLYPALMRLSDIDGAMELLAGLPLLELDDNLAIRTRPTELAPPGAWQPLIHIADQKVQQVVREHTLLVLTRASFGESDVLVGMWNQDSGVLEALAKMILPDPLDPKHDRGMWIGLPDLPAALPTDRPVRIVLQITSLLPEYRLWLRIGEQSLACFRTTRRDFRGFVGSGLRAIRKDVVEKSQVMVFDLPAGYVEPGARKLALRAEAFSVTESGEAAPMAMWVSDLSIGSLAR